MLCLTRITLINATGKCSISVAKIIYGRARKGLERDIQTTIACRTTKESQKPPDLCEKLLMCKVCIYY